jgi:urease accessory protein
MFWTLAQLADSAFPSGGFAHSGGLEAAYQVGLVNSVSSCEQFLADNLEQAGQAYLPFVTATHQEPARLHEFDQWFDTTMTNHIANRASRATGMGFLHGATAAFGVESLSVVKSAVRSKKTPGHFPPLIGFIAQALTISLTETQQFFIYQHARTLLSSAIRLGIIGPLEAQALQYRSRTVYDAVLTRHATRLPDEAASAAPLHDIAHGFHDRLYSRLFMS